MQPILRIIAHFGTLLLRSPTLLFDYWVQKKRFEKEFSDAIERYPFSPEAKKELLGDLKQLSLKNMINAVKTPGQS